MIVFSININDEDPVWTPELDLDVSARDES